MAVGDNAAINFSQNHPPRETTRKGQNPSLGTILCTKPSPRDKTGSQKPHPLDIRLENFTNVSINSDTI